MRDRHDGPNDGMYGAAGAVALLLKYARLEVVDLGGRVAECDVEGPLVDVQAEIVAHVIGRALLGIHAAYRLNGVRAVQFIVAFHKNKTKQQVHLHADS